MESGQEVIFNVILYGSDGPRKPHESRVELELRVRLPADIEDDVNVKGAWLRKWVLQTDGVVEDLKHSHDWRCEFCAKPARESIISISTWLRESPPRAKAYLHAFCNAASPRCRDEFDIIDKFRTEMSGQVWQPVSRRRLLPRGEYLPLLGSCVGCEEDKTAGPGVGRKGVLMRCSGCKLTSEECQKKHWKVHKVACKAVRKVKWVLKPEQS